MKWPTTTLIEFRLDVLSSLFLTLFVYISVLSVAIVSETATVWHEWIITAKNHSIFHFNTNDCRSYLWIYRKILHSVQSQCILWSKNEKKRQATAADILTPNGIAQYSVLFFSFRVKWNISSVEQFRPCIWLRPTVSTEKFLQPLFLTQTISSKLLYGIATPFVQRISFGSVHRYIWICFYFCNFRLRLSQVSLIGLNHFHN